MSPAKPIPTGTRVRTRTGLGEPLYGTVESFDGVLYAVRCPDIGYTIYRRREKLVVEKVQKARKKYVRKQTKSGKPIAREPKVFKCHVKIVEV